jgi:hypothetical protein
MPRACSRVVAVDGKRMTSVELAEVHLGALYSLSAGGLIAASRDATVTPPWFHLLRMPVGNRWLLGAALGSAQRKRLASILSVERPISDCVDALAHPPDLGTIRRALADLGSVREYRGPAFFFPNEVSTPERAELLADLTEAPRDGPFAWLRSAPATSHPVAIVRGDHHQVASVCYSARSTAVAAEAGVETADEYRGRGYGSMAVLGWAAAVRKSGRTALYSTEWENMASRALASRLGLICYAEDLHM